MIDTVYFYTWRAGVEGNKLLKKAREAFYKLLDNPIKIEIIDLSVYGDSATDKVCVVFGNTALKTIENLSLAKKHILVTDVKTMLDGKGKKETFEELQKIAKYINEHTEENPTQKYIETQEGVTIGESMCDINITTTEAEYLKKIKELLGGGKIVITKGDLKIEVE